jgi:cytochrome b561
VRLQVVLVFCSVRGAGRRLTIACAAEPGFANHESVFAFRTITGHLFLYALALAVPILLMSSFIGWASIRQENQRVESLAERQAVQAVPATDNRLDALAVHECSFETSTLLQLRPDHWAACIRA